MRIFVEHRLRLNDDAAFVLALGARLSISILFTEKMDQVIIDDYMNCVCFRVCDLRLDAMTVHDNCGRKI